MTALLEHVIEAKNLVLGNARFLTLPLPDNWELAPGVAHPEVSASHTRGSVRWVAHGDFWYVVYHPERGWALEVYGRVRQGLRGGDGRREEVVSANGHPATVQWKARRRGPPWRRHDVTYMTVRFECPSSERAIALEFSGWCPEEGFREILKALYNLKCH